MRVSAKHLGLATIVIAILGVCLMLALSTSMLHSTKVRQAKSNAINSISTQISNMTTSLAMSDLSSPDYYPRLFKGSESVLARSIRLANQQDLGNLGRLLQSVEGNFKALEKQYNRNPNASFFTNLRSQILLQLSRIFEEANRLANDNYTHQNQTSENYLVLISTIGLCLFVAMITSAMFYLKCFLNPVTLLAKQLKDYDGKSLKLNSTLKVTELEGMLEVLNKSQKTLMYNATHDDLTGLHNRAYFKKALAKEIQKNKAEDTCTVLIYMDIDNFKQVNDSLGHLHGDSLLKEFAIRLTSLAEKDCVARLGGDEFTLLVRSVAQDQANAEALRMVTKIQQLQQQPFDVHNHSLNVSASMGLLIIPHYGDDIDIAMRNVDSALYEAKRNGKATYAFYEPRLTEEADRVLKLENEIENAISSDEFVLHYQPQVNVKSNTIEGLEALIRWQHPERGLIGPYEFIPIAERSLLIHQLGLWVIRKAFAQCEVLRKTWEHVPKISINIDSRQLEQPDIIETVVALLDNYDVRAENFTFELTESTFLHHSDTTIATILKLRELGFTFALDDFGTGYSCLSYINRLPVDIIKIDKEFVDSIILDELNTSALDAIIVLAAGLSIKLIGEGVEEKSQLDYLQSKGCYIIQGYYFSKPVAIENMSELTALQQRLSFENGGASMHPEIEVENMTTMKLETENARDIVVTRRFSAPPEALYRAHIDPQLIKKWMLGPPGWSMPVCINEARAKGKIRYEWSNGNGGGFYLTGEYIELEQNRRLVHVERMHLPEPTPDNHIETLFEPDASGTLMTIRMTLPSAEVRSAMLESGMQHGMEASYVNLETVLNAPK